MVMRVERCALSPTTAHRALPRRQGALHAEFGRDSKAGCFTRQADWRGPCRDCELCREELVTLSPSING